MTLWKNVLPPRKFIRSSHKGSAVLALVIVCGIFSSMMGLASAKVSSVTNSSLSSSKTSAQALQYAETQAGVGTVITWASAKNPNENGTWLECNGQSCAAYPDLVKVLGSSSVPDYRGVFLRGLGSVTSTHYGTVQHQSNGLGELQGDAIRNIYGDFSTFDVGGIEYPTGAFQHAHDKSIVNCGRAWSSTYNDYLVSFNAYYVVPTTNEDRPINRAVRYFIKAA